MKSQIPKRKKPNKKKTAKSIPKGYTEEEVVEILENVARRLCSRFKFGYHDIEDIKQQAILEGWKVLTEKKYNGEHPLENFLWVHVKNRLVNFKRDNYERITKPCEKCPYKAYDKENNECLKYGDNLEDCKFYHKWIMRNAAKKNLVDTIDVDNVDDEHENRMKIYDAHTDHVDARKIDIILLEELKLEYLNDYDRFKVGAKLSKDDREKIKEQICIILEKHGIDTTAY